MILSSVVIITFVIVEANGIPVEEVSRKLLPRITGSGYTEIRKVPYQAQIINDDSYLYCGATIIDKEWLLSASHCFIDRSKKLTVLTGSTFRLNGKESYIDKVFNHPEFNEVTLNNDISLIKLKEPLEFNEKQKAIELLYKDVKDGELIQISGYGRESDHSQHSPVIKVAEVPVINKNKCRNKYAQVNDTISDSMFCAGNGEEDACLGDSGGPTVYKGFLVGVISAGRFCRSKEFPGVYTRISVYRDWIKKTIRLNSQRIDDYPFSWKILTSDGTLSLDGTMTSVTLVYPEPMKLSPYQPLESYPQLQPNYPAPLIIEPSLFRHYKIHPYNMVWDRIRYRV